MTPYPSGKGPKRRHRVAATLNREELFCLRKVRRYVGSVTGDRSVAEALRFLIRDWEPR